MNTRKDIKEHTHIPVTKVQRASRFITTGAKLGSNYLKHYSKKLINPALGRDELHEANARDIYNSLSELKGSALKVAQMLSMDRSLLPTAYQQKFTLAQYSAPPLSYPLVVNTFQQAFKKRPDQIFDQFNKKARNAASMGQVHEAVLGAKKLAVKVQYPGVGRSVKSDLAMVKPIALRMFDLNPIEYEEFIQEVEARLMEETDYGLELRRSIELSQKSKHIKNVIFPTYYPEFSSDKILAMDWLDGEPLGDALKRGIPSPAATKIGQAMWDFYQFQIHKLKVLHADPHPGNFIITPEYHLGIIDFGCVKEMSATFYKTYFQLLEKDLLQQPEKLDRVFRELRFIYDDDSEWEVRLFKEVFTDLVELLSRPFRSETFNFADESYFKSVYALGERLSQMKELRQSKKTRGIKDALYINRTYFGLYSLLHELKVTVVV